MKVVNLQVSVSAPAIQADDVLGQNHNRTGYAQPRHIDRLIDAVNASLSRLIATVQIVGDDQPLDVDTIDPQLLLSCAEALMQKYQERTKK